MNLTKRDVEWFSYRDAKKSPQLAPAGEGGMVEEISNRQKLHEFIEFIQEIVAQDVAFNR